MTIPERDHGADAATPDECEPAQSERRSRLASPARRFQQASSAVADRGGVFYGGAGHDNSEYRCANDGGGAARCSAQHEVSARKLHFEPCGFYSHQWVDGGPVRNAPRVRIRDRHLHAGIISVRNIEQPPRACRLPHFTGLRRIHDGTRRPAHSGADVRKVRTGPRDELRCHSRADWPDARANRGRADRRIFSLESYLLPEYSDWTGRFGSGLPALAGLSRTDERS